MTNEQIKFQGTREWEMICNHKMRGANIQFTEDADDGKVRVVACFKNGKERFLFRLSEQEAFPFKECI